MEYSGDRIVELLATKLAYAEVEAARFQAMVEARDQHIQRLNETIKTMKELNEEEEEDVNST